MALETFKNSQALSMGVELELQLISLSNFDLVAASPDRGRAEIRIKNVHNTKSNKILS